LRVTNFTLQMGIVCICSDMRWAVCWEKARFDGAGEWFAGGAGLGVARSARGVEDVGVLTVPLAVGQPAPFPATKLGLHGACEVKHIAFSGGIGSSGRSTASKMVTERNGSCWRAIVSRALCAYFRTC